MPVEMIVGPTGGGKSTASARRCLRVAMWQEPSPRDGVRRARTVCICPTYRRAWDTVMPSYFKVFPQSLGDFRGSRGDPADHIFDWPRVMPDGSVQQLHVEVLFRAVNDLDLEEFFRGLEATAFWFPEADTNEDEAILSLASNRVGRYPEPDDRPEGKPAYKGVFGDANAPKIGGWFHQRFYLRRRPGDRLWRQPGGFSPNAENMANLRKIDPDYYGKMAAQLDEYDIHRLIRNLPGFGRHGSPVHRNFDHDRHVATRTLDVSPHLDVVIGVDAGSGALRPGATFTQVSPMGQHATKAEIFVRKDEQMATPEFAEAIVRMMNTRFQHARGAVISGDPAMAAQGAATGVSTAMHLQALTNIEVQLAQSNKPERRRGVMNTLLKENCAPGEPRKVIDPGCVGLIAGYAGGFHYPKRGAETSPLPKKNEYSNIVEADEYGAMGVEGTGMDDSRFIRPGAADAYAPIKVILEG